ncbi:kinase-like protein [Meredithblackwellia eburnea MCA 4105]
MPVSMQTEGDDRDGDIKEGEGVVDDAAFDLFKNDNENEASRLTEKEHGHQTANGAHEDEVSAADYNPDEDRKNDDRRHAERIGTAATVKEENPVEVLNQTQGNDEDDDDDDMFSIGVKPVKMSTGPTKPAYIPVINRALDATTTGLVDNFDDEEGYYKVVLGEILDNGRYHVHANLGKGMFSAVVRAKDTHSSTGAEVAIKLIRSQETMYKAGLKEANILRKLQEADPTDKRHLVRLERTFEHRGHLCLVFESLSMNLREVVKRYGKDVGINLRAVRAYASQMILGLALMKKCDIMHADIKPDNILVNESKSMLKICDLGSASDVSENDITPYLCSRFYRAPEIILGLPYDCSLDTWSIGCTLYELFTGKILFPGRTNNHMLYLIMELKGKVNHKMLKKARFCDQHFDESLNFVYVDKNDSQKVVSIPSKATHDLRSRLMPTSAMKKLKDDEVKLLGNFVDLLDKMLNLDPTKRPTPKEILNHPFLRG